LSEPTTPTSALPERIETLTVAQGTFSIGRLAAGKAPVRAWDAADELVLGHVADHDLITSAGADGRRIAVVNDAYGALGTALAASAPFVVGDVVTSQNALFANLARNGLASDAVTFVPTGGDLGAVELGLVIVKVPKTTALLEAQLRALTPHLDTSSVVVGAAMARHLHRSALDVFERVLGTTTTSLATRKARLVHPVLDAGIIGAASATTPDRSFEHDGLTIVERPGVFSAGRVDGGTELLLDAVQGSLQVSGAFDGAETIIDLACGNGIIGTAIGRLVPDAQMVTADVSWSAVTSAQATWAANLGDRALTAVVADCLPASVAADGSADVIVTNPPFHADHAIGDATAWRMFNDMHRALKPGGWCLVVGNQHLAYHAKLNRIFGNSTVIASNPKFVVLRADRR